MSIETLQSWEDRPLVAAAVDLAIAELYKIDPSRAEDATLREEVFLAIITVAAGGVTDPRQLARHAVVRCAHSVTADKK